VGKSEAATTSRPVAARPADADVIRFRLLGPVTVSRGGVPVPLRAPMPRNLLAALLLSANRAVSTRRLIDTLWGDDPPVTAAASLHNHVRRLRASLAAGQADADPGGAANTGADGGSGRIWTVAPGYLIEVAEGELDLAVFSELLLRGRNAAATGEWDTAARELTAALALWRGDPLADVTSLVLRESEAPRLLQLRLDAFEGRIDADLQLGRIQEAIQELGELTAAYPLRERFHAQLMLACYRSGRQADALAAYRRARNALAGQLGIEPGTELRQLHERILAADPELGAASRMSAMTRPAQLPADVADFTGRDVQVKQLSDLLAGGTASRQPGAVVVAALSGAPGTGKTALAIHVAHLLAAVFPDGLLHASLDGATSPVEPGKVLASFLRDLGVPDSAIPADEAERAGRYRTLLSGRRMLVVLDDARDAGQVRPLLPGSATCAVIITSRRALTDLAGASPLSVSVLGEDEASALFTAIVGRERVSGEPEAAASVLAYCGGLPLAIRIAAARLASRPSWSIASFAGLLSDERRRLSELASGDVAVRASFAVSYRALPAGDMGAAGIFRMLGLANATSISLPAVTALADGPQSQVGQALEMLIDAHLVETAGPGRYRLHDLLRIYAAELADKDGTPQQRRAAIRRMLDWYRQRAIAAIRGQMHSSTAYSPPGADPAFAFRSPQEALDWCEVERANLVAAVRRAAELGMPDIAAQIPAALWLFFQRRPYQDDWRTTHEIGLACARETGDAYTEGWLLNSLGKLHARAARFDDAHHCLAEALAIRRRLADAVGECRVLNTIGVTYLAQDRPEPALSQLRQALAIGSALHSDIDIAIVNTNLGDVSRRMRHFDEALASLERALALFRQIGDRYGEGITETSIGETLEAMDRPDEAITHYESALAAHDEAGPDDVERTDALRNLARAYGSLGQSAEARAAWRAALPILDRLGDPAASEIRALLAKPAGLPGHGGSHHAVAVRRWHCDSTRSG
jgi:DNA-binding SARP family transcriptional activator